jgi:aryl-alcohol dehydrogenase-like predicted oxidoreductase
VTLPTATFGRTGVTVSKLGYGAMELRSPQLDARAVDRLLGTVLDAGITVIDTAPDYGASEEHIGRAISHRRDEYFLATKCGCPVGEPVGASGPVVLEHLFTRDNVRAAVEQSLDRMRTDHLDLVQFHVSPSPATLAEQDGVAELLAQRDAGKVRFIGISGTLPHLPGQIGMGVFDAFQIPYSAIERDHEEVIGDAARAGGGTIIRGGVGRWLQEPPASLPEQWQETIRARKRKFEQTGISELLGDMTPMEFFLRFTIGHPDMHTTIIGTTDPEHLAANVAAASRGALPPDVRAAATARYSAE